MDLTPSDNVSLLPNTEISPTSVPSVVNVTRFYAVSKFSRPLSPRPADVPRRDMNMMILPMTTLIVFVIIVCVKITHWWNEDIRLSDGMMVNVYNPRLPPRRVLARVYSTEPSSSSSTSKRMSIFALADEAGSKLSPRCSSSTNTKYAETSFSTEEDIFRLPENVSRDAPRVGAGRRQGLDSGTRAKSPNSSPTRSLHSGVAAAHRASSTQRAGRPRRVRRQTSSVSVKSCSTYRSDSSGDNMPLLRRQQSDRQFGIANKALRNTSSVSLSRQYDTRKLSPQLRRLSPLASRACSESNLGLSLPAAVAKLGGAEGVTAGTMEEISEEATISKLLKHSLQLNISLLTNMTDTGTLQSPRGEASPADGKLPATHQPVHCCTSCSSTEGPSCPSATTSNTTLSSAKSSLNSCSSSSITTPKKTYMDLYPAIFHLHTLLRDATEEVRGQRSMTSSTNSVFANSPESGLGSFACDEAKVTKSDADSSTTRGQASGEEIPLTTARCQYILGGEDLDHLDPSPHKDTGCESLTCDKQAIEMSCDVSVIRKPCLDTTIPECEHSDRAPGEAQSSDRVCCEAPYNERVSGESQYSERPPREAPYNKDAPSEAPCS